MDNVIKLLPESIANQIAAGEVVQRPASVVKELLENSIDAGADEISLHIREAGKSFIQVTDNGCGMSETDARMCFERHATSKITSAQDLYKLRTLGFRGEALASIASVASVELKTRRKQDALGTFVRVEGGKVVVHEPIACSEGTSVTVKNLFFNIPVRKNFLKSNNVEYRYILEEFFHVALPYPDIRFVMSSAGQEVFHLLKSSLRQRITSLFGKRYEKYLLPVEEETSVVKISGFIGKPEASRKTRGDQYIFVNKRFIRNSFFNHAVKSAYENLIPSENFPFYVLFLEIDPSKIDVNVHPTKTEVKFEDEKVIYAILKAVVKKSLGQFHLGQNIDFEHEAFLNQLHKEKLEWEENRNKIKVDKPEKLASPKIPTLKANEKDWQELLKILNQEKNTASSENETIDKAEFIPELGLNSSEQSHDESPLENKVIQIHNKYIITPVKSGIMVIHQQYAHQRILFEDFLKKCKNKTVSAQKLMFPENLNFNKKELSIIKEIYSILKENGFEVEFYDDHTLKVAAAPAQFNTHQLKELFDAILEDYHMGNENFKEVMQEKIAVQYSINNAIKAGSSLQKEEIINMVDQLFACENPYYSPLGKPVFFKINEEELDKKFS